MYIVKGSNGEERRHLRQVAWHVSSSGLITKAIDTSHGGHLASRREAAMLSSMLLGASGGFFRSPATPNPLKPHYVPLLLRDPLTTLTRPRSWPASASTRLSLVPARSGDA